MCEPPILDPNEAFDPSQTPHLKLPIAGPQHTTSQPEAQSNVSELFASNTIVWEIEAISDNLD